MASIIRLTSASGLQVRASSVVSLGLPTERMETSAKDQLDAQPGHQNCSLRPVDTRLPVVGPINSGGRPVDPRALVARRRIRVAGCRAPPQPAAAITHRQHHNYGNCNSLTVGAILWFRWWHWTSRRLSQEV